MKTQTQKSHRHFLVAPFAALLIGISFMQWDTMKPKSITGEIVEHTVQNTTVQELPSGTRAFLEDGANLDISGEFPSIEQGSVLFDSKGLLHVTAGKVRIFGLHGVIHVSHNNGKVSIATVSSPAVVRFGGHYALLPIGKQWTIPVSLPSESVGYRLWLSARTGKNISERFQEQSLKKVALFNAYTDTGLPDTAFFKPTLAQRLRFEILLPETRLQAEAKWDERYLGYFRSVVEKQDRTKIQAMLQEESMKHILLSERGQQVVAHLIADQQNGSEFFVSLLHELTFANPDIWLVASMHPRYADTTWLLGSPSLAQEPRLLALLEFPVSDTAKKPFSQMAIRNWIEGVRLELESFQSPETLLPLLVTHLFNSTEILEKIGYPIRAQDIATAASLLLSKYEDVFSDEVKETYNNLISRQQVHIYEYIRQEEVLEAAKQEQENVAQKELPVVPTLSSEKIESIAEEVLLEGGALFTVDTTIRAIAEPNIAHVRKIVFSTPNKDRTFDFMLNVTTGQITRITENGNTFPNAMWVEDFVKWAKQ